MGGETTFALNNLSPITLAFAGQSVWRDAAAFACLCGFARRGVGLGDGFLFCARAVAKSAGHSPLPMNGIRMCRLPLLVLRGAGVPEPGVYPLPSSAKCDCELISNISAVISNASKKRSHWQVGGKYACGGRIIGPDTVCFETAG